MDEADPEMLERLAKYLNKNRKPEWIDIHNMKIQQFGSRLHIDAHITLPWYFELRTAHDEMEEVIKLIAKTPIEQWNSIFIWMIANPLLVLFVGLITAQFASKHLQKR